MRVLALTPSSKEFYMRCKIRAFLISLVGARAEVKELKSQPVSTSLLGAVSSKLNRRKLTGAIAEAN